MSQESGHRKKWDEVPVPMRAGLLVLGGAETALKVWSLADLARRPGSQVHGRKGVWAVGLILVNSVGALPLAYLCWGRRA